MNKAYSIRFVVEDLIDNKLMDEHTIANYESNKYIPIPMVGCELFLDDYDKHYIVKRITYAYPSQENEEFNYEVCVFLEECK